MNTRQDPRKIALDLLRRMVCNVKVAALIVDKSGRKIQWGWNHPGPDDSGEHAEAHAIRRANEKRLRGSTIYVAGMRSRNMKLVPSRPCDKCMAKVRRFGINTMVYMAPSGWVTENIF